ncbi:carboxypeptidase regulatory-like domain-containing protein, partial [Calditrichota bacterium]
MKSVLSLALMLITIACLAASTSFARVTLNPHGVSVYAENGDSLTSEIAIYNDGNWNIVYEAFLKNRDDQQRGPRRDDFGDVLDFYDYANYGWCGIAWNQGTVMLADWDNSHIYLWSLDEEEFINDWGVNYNPWSIAFDGDTYWVTEDANNRVHNVEVDGDELDSFDLNFSPAGIAWDGQDLWLTEYYENNVIHRFTVEGEEVDEFDIGDIDDTESLALTWVPEHDNPLWSISENGLIQQLEIDFDAEEVNAIQSSRLNYGDLMHYGLTHDSENLWFSTYSNNNEGWGFGIVDDGIEEVVWIYLMNAEGEIAEDDSGLVTVIFQPSELEAGVYEKVIQLQYVEGDHEELLTVECSVVMSLESGTSNFEGDVVAAYNDEALAQAIVSLDLYDMNRVTDEDGGFQFDNLPSGDYVVTVTRREYQPYSEEFNFESGEDYEMHAELLHGEFNLDQDNFEFTLEYGEIAEDSFTATNDGDAPLTYTSEIHHPGGLGNLDPFATRINRGIGQELEDPRLMGVTFYDNEFFVSGRGDEEKMIYVLDRDGELQRSFVQAGEGNQGMPDLTCDPVTGKIYGSGEDDIYAFDKDGEVQSVIHTNLNTIRGIAWDPDREVLWCCATTTDFFPVDMEGNVDEDGAIDRHGFYTASLAYFPADRDGYNLYVTHEIDSRQVIHKINIETGDTMFVADFPEEDGTPGGSSISPHYDIYHWVYMTIPNNADSDTLYVKNVDWRWDFLNVEPRSGMIAAGESQVFTITVEEVFPYIFEMLGMIDFYHDGFGEYATVDVSMMIVEPPPPLTEFNLLEPVNEDTVYEAQAAELTFAWQPSVQVNGESPVTYTLWLELGEDSTFVSVAEDTSIVVNLPEVLELMNLEDDNTVEWWVTANWGGWNQISNQKFSFQLLPDDRVENTPSIPIEFGIHAAYPNPFNSITTVRFGLP